jgi:hypothetical protein
MASGSLAVWGVGVLGMRVVAGIAVAAITVLASTGVASADRPPITVGFASASSSVSEASSTVDVVVERTGRGRSTVDVTPSFGGSAAGDTACGSGADYVVTPVGGATLTQTRPGTATVTFTLCPDSVDEADETVVLRIANPSSGVTVAGDGVTVITITDDDDAPTCSDDAISDDTFATATVMAHGVTYDRVSCPGNADWFVVNETVQRMFITKTGAFDLIVYDADGQIVAYLDWQVSTVEMPILTPQSFSFEAVQPFPTGSAYSLRVNFSVLLPTSG